MPPQSSSERSPVISDWSMSAPRALHHLRFAIRWQFTFRERTLARRNATGRISPRSVTQQARLSLWRTTPAWIDTALSAAEAGKLAVLEPDGGELPIERHDSDDRVLMTGPVELERMGELLGAA